MAKVIIALGSNVGDRVQHLSDARQFLSELSENGIEASSIYISEAVGPSERPFLNAVVSIAHTVPPEQLLNRLKQFEREHGRDMAAPRWSARTIDLDMISYDHLREETEQLILPHPEYRKRLFVLLPLKEIEPEWEDPETGHSIDRLIDQAPSLIIHKTELDW